MFVLICDLRLLIFLPSQHNSDLVQYNITSSEFCTIEVYSFHNWCNKVLQNLSIDLKIKYFNEHLEMHSNSKKKNTIMKKVSNVTSNNL